jgi:hypothetical protein
MLTPAEQEIRSSILERGILSVEATETQGAQQGEIPGPGYGHISSEKVEAAKEKEMASLKSPRKYKEVSAETVGDARVIGSRWVIGEKADGQVKARHPTTPRAQKPSFAGHHG